MERSADIKYDFSLFSVFFLLMGSGSAILLYLPSSLLSAALDLLKMSQVARTFLEGWFTSVLIPVLPLVSSGFILMAGILFLGRRKLQRWIQNLITRILCSEEIFFQDTHSCFGMPVRNLVIWFLICSMFVVAHYGPTLIHGFFHGDDFIMLSLRRIKPLSELIFLPLADHTIPVWRLELAAMASLFGVSALPYNIFLLTIFVLILYLTVLIMRELRVNQVGIVIALMLFSGLAAWGEMTSGFYTLSMYSQILLLCLLSIWAYVRWRKTAKTILLLISAVSMGTAPFVSIAGSWVPFAIVIFALSYHLANSPNAGLKSFVHTDGWLLTAVLATAVLAVAYNTYVFTIISPGNFLSMPGDQYATSTSLSVVSVLQQLFFILAGGILLTTFFPIGYWHLPIAVLVPILVALSLFAIITAFFVWRRMDRPTKCYSLSILLIILGTCGIVAVGRQFSTFAHPWPAKYIGTPYFWYCVLIGLAWNTLWKRTKAEYKSIFLKLSVLLIAIFLCVQTIFDAVTSKISLTPTYGYGFRAHISGAKARKEALTTLRNNLVTPLLQLAPKQLAIPTLDGPYMNNVYPNLPVYLDVSYYRDFVVPNREKVIFLRNLAMQRELEKLETDVKPVTSMRAATDEVFIKALENDPYVQRLYLSSVPLEFGRDCDEDFSSWKPSRDRLTNPGRVALNGNGQLFFESRGKAALTIQEGQWDPETAHELRIGIQGFSYAGEPVRLELNFSGELKIPYPNPWIELTSHQVHCISVDLLQVYAYALNPRVKDLALRFRTPGIYKISQVALQSD